MIPFITPLSRFLPWAFILSPLVCSVFYDKIQINFHLVLLSLVKCLKFLFLLVNFPPKECFSLLMPQRWSFLHWPKFDHTLVAGYRSNLDKFRCKCHHILYWRLQFFRGFGLVLLFCWSFLFPFLWWFWTIFRNFPW